MPGASVSPTSKHGDILLSLLITALSTSSSCSKGHCTGEAINQPPCPYHHRMVSVFTSSVVVSYWPLACSQNTPFSWLPSVLRAVTWTALETTLPQVQMIHFYVWTFQLQISDLTSHRHLRFKTSFHYSFLSTWRTSELRPGHLFAL